jgi:hypothetical protein
VVPLVLGAGALVLVVVIGWLLLNGDNDPQENQAADRSPSAPPSSPATRQPTPKHTSEAMEQFVADYLTTAANNPPAGYRLLTPQYQAESGGFAGYEGFWGDVSNVRIQSIEADVDTLSVTYSYSYNLRGSGSRSDTVRMQLQPNGDDGYLIADAVTVG